MARMWQGVKGAALLAAALSAAPALAQFNSAAEVKPILQMTRANWIAVREFNGQDLLYFTHLEVYRCGLDQIRYRINGGLPEVWQTPPCPGDQTFAEIPADRLPYAVFPPNSIETVWIELTYDDGSVERVEYARGDIETP